MRPFTEVPEEVLELVPSGILISRLRLQGCRAQRLRDLEVVVVLARQSLFEYLAQQRGRPHDCPYSHSEQQWCRIQHKQIDCTNDKVEEGQHNVQLDAAFYVCDDDVLSWETR